MSSSSAPVPDTALGPTYLIPGTIFVAIALAVCTGRIWTRLRPKPHLGWDDHLIIIAEVLSLAGFCLSAAAVGHGWGHMTAYVDPADATIAHKCIFAVEILWMISIVFVRASVACSLLPLSTARLWKWTLWILIALQVVLAIMWMTITLAGCKPLRAFWDAGVYPTCWDVRITINLGWVSAGLYIISDLTLALMPIKLIRTLNRPLREKIAVGILMGLGLVATSTVCVKMTTFKAVNSGDPLSATVIPSLYAKLEEVIGIIAACMPALKQTGEALLKKWGIMKEVPANGQMSRPSFVISLKDVGKSKTGGDTIGVGDLDGGKASEAALYEGGKAEWHAGSSEITIAKTSDSGRTTSKHSAQA
ncbi:hypothetical protein B0J14DRAFT_605078 [Halenospora varia]|nr:hypothetical protein B0J14DRAFT_605078 [Halenospora varia]